MSDKNNKNKNNDNNNEEEEGEFPLSEGLDASISEGDDSYFLLSYLMKRRQQQGRSLLNKNKGSSSSSSSSPTGPTISSSSSSSSSPFNANITPLYGGRKLKINRDNEKQQDNDQEKNNNNNNNIDGDNQIKDHDNEYEDDFELDSPDNLSKSVMSFIDKSRNRMAIKSISNSLKRETSPPKSSSLSPTIKSNISISPRNRPPPPVSPSSLLLSSKGIQAFVPPLPEARVPYPGYSTENLQIRNEVEETEDIKVLRQLLRNSIADQFALSQSSKSLMQDNKQLNDENKALQIRVASLQHTMVLTTRKFQLPMKVWHKLNQVITYKKSKAFDNWRQLMFDFILDRRLSNYCCYNVTIKRYRRLQRSALITWKEGILFNNKMFRILKISDDKVRYKIFRKWIKFVKNKQTRTLTRKFNITHGFSLVTSVARRRNQFMTSKGFHRWVAFLRYSEQKDMEKSMADLKKQNHFEMAREKAKCLVKSKVRIKHFFMRQAIGMWRYLIFHVEYKINMGRKIILGQARRYQRQTLIKWRKFVAWDRKVTTFTKEVNTRVKNRIFTAWKGIPNLQAESNNHIRVGERLIAMVLKRKFMLLRHKYFIRWVHWNKNISSIMHSDAFNKFRMKSILRQLFSTTEDIIRSYFKKWLYNTTIVNHAQERARNVILRWLRREQKCGLNKWKEFIKWHRRITGLFDQGPERRKAEVIRRWKEYNIWCKGISKHGREASRLITALLSKRFQYIIMKRFHRWKATVVNIKLNELKFISERELTIKYINKMQIMATSLIREAFRIWWTSSFYNDKLRDRTRNVMIGWLKKNKKAALNKWIDSTNWHRRVTQFFGVGPKRMKAAMMRRWKQYTLQNKNLMPLRRQCARILYTVASRRALLKCNKAFSRWLLVNNSYRSKKLLDYIHVAREKTLKQKMKYYIQLMCSKAQVLVRDAFRQWQASLLFQDRQLYVGKKVLLRCFRRKQKAAVLQWKAFVTWHKTVLQKFDSGNRRLVKRIMLRWKIYVMKMKKRIKLAQDGVMKLINVARRRCVILVARRFYEWRKTTSHVAMVRYNILKWRAVVRGNRKRKIEAITHIFANIKKSLDRKIYRCYQIWRRITMLTKLSFPSLCNKWFRRWTMFTVVKKLKKAVRKRALYPILLRKFKEQLIVAMKRWKRQSQHLIKVSNAHKGIRSIRLAFKNKFLNQIVQKRFWKWRDVAKRETRIARVLNKCSSMKKANTMEAGFKLWKGNCERRRVEEAKLKGAVQKISTHRKVIQSLALHTWRVHSKLISSEKILISKITSIAQEQRMKSLTYNATIVSQNARRQSLYRCFRFWRSCAKKLAVPLGGSVIINALTTGRVWSDKIRSMSKVDRIPKPHDAIQIAIAALYDILSPINYKPSVYFKQTETTLFGAHCNDDDVPSEMDPRNTSLSTIYNTSRIDTNTNVLGSVFSDSPLKCSSTKSTKANVITMGVGVIGKCAESGIMKVFRGDLKGPPPKKTNDGTGVALATVFPLYWDNRLVGVIQLTAVGLDCNSVFVDSSSTLSVDSPRKYPATPIKSSLLSPISQIKGGSYLDVDSASAISQKQYPDLYQVALALGLNREQLTTLGIVVLELCEFFGRYYAVGNTEGDKARAIMHQIAEYPKLIEMKVSQEELRQKIAFIEEEYSQASERIKTQSLLIEKLEKSRQKHHHIAEEKSKLLDETTTQLDALKEQLKISEKRAKHFEKQLEEVHKLEAVLHSVVSRE